MKSSISMQLTKPLKINPVVGLLAVSIWIAGSGLTALGADVFILDTSQSYVSISGNVVGSPIREQGPGSLTAHYGGTLLAEVSADTIQFPGQSQMVAFNSGSWQPLADGGDGSEPANYGGTATAFFTTGVAAIREMRADVTSGVVAITDGRFDTQGLTFFIPADAPSSLSYRLRGLYNSSGVESLRGESATGQEAQASLTTAGDQQVLAIPINYTFYYSLVAQNDSAVTLRGQLVATRSLSAPIPPQWVTPQWQDSPNQDR
jgi:hypothetical protein